MMLYQWQYQKAFIYYQQALSITERTIGKENIQYAYCLEGLASYYYNTGDYKQAAVLSRRALVLKEKLYGKNYYAIGFKNNAGGYELRNEKFKASSSPKDITLIESNAEKLTVFEGFFNFLSYFAIHHKQEQPATNFLVLNSTSFFEKSLPLMQSHKSVHLYLDCDTTGQKCIQKALGIDKEKFIDERCLYKNYKDFNDWIMNIGKTQKQVLQAKL